MPNKITVDDYRYTTAMLFSCSRRKLRRIARRFDLEARSHHIVYQGLTHEQSVAVARMNRDDAIYVLSHKG